MAREPGAGERALVPLAVAALAGEQVVDAAPYRVAHAVFGGEQAEDRPGRLRGCRGAASGQSFVVVGCDRLTPAAVVVLALREPGSSAAHVRRLRFVANGAQTGERRPRAVDEIDAPAAPPRPVG